MRRFRVMRAIALIAVMLLLIFWGCVAAEEYIKVNEYNTGMTHNVLKSSYDWYIKGNQFNYMNGSYELAIKCYDRAIELDPSYDEPWVNKGYCLKHLGKYDEALKAFDNATRLNPLLSLYDEKGDILLGQGKYDEALDAYNSSIVLDPKDKEAWTQKGYVLGLLGKYNDSIKASDKVIYLGSSNIAYAWYNKGIALKALGRATEADAALAKAKELGIRADL